MDASTNGVLLGELKKFHSFNGTIQVPRGWMKANGDQINETNYDAIHGTGAYEADGIADMVLDGKYTPNMIDKYSVGASETTQDGSSAITSVGNTNHASSHNHKYYEHSDPYNASDYSYDSAGNLAVIDTEGHSTGYTHLMAKSSSATVNYGSAPLDMWTANDSTDVQPESIEVIYIIRVGV
jgi:hypothetical protein